MDIRIKASIQASSKTSFDKLWIKYSQYADGTDFVDTWESGYDYIGFAVAYLEPTEKEAYSWCQFAFPVDSQIDAESVNPVQNKVIKETLDNFYVSAGQAVGVVKGNKATAEGEGVQAFGDSAHAEGYYTMTKNKYAHAEGKITLAQGEASHAEGRNTSAKGDYSHVEGDTSSSSGACSHAEGSHTTASGDISHAEGSQVTASGNYSHAEGSVTRASGAFSHAEGYDTTASGGYSHVEGYRATASGNGSHAEGDNTIASGNISHAEGQNAIAEGDASHAEGCYTVASGNNSHAEGFGTTTNYRSEHVFGEFNVDYYPGQADERGTFIEIVGNGADDMNRSNARTLDWNGNEVLAGKLTVGAGPENDMDVSTKKYVDDAISAIRLELGI